MDCKIYHICPYARHCSIVKDAEFCAYHQQHAPEIKLDFIPVDDDPVIHKDVFSTAFDGIVQRANQRSFHERGLK